MSEPDAQPDVATPVQSLSKTQPSGAFYLPDGYAMIAFGANLGDPNRTFEKCIDRIGRFSGTEIVCVSALIETEPVDCPAGSPSYRNGAILVQTRLSPINLLRQLQRLEYKLGRVRSVRNAPRTCDLDLLLWGAWQLGTDVLVLPHPRMWEREFVMIPVNEIMSQYPELVRR